MQDDDPVLSSFAKERMLAAPSESTASVALGHTHYATYVDGTLESTTLLQLCTVMLSTL